LSRSGFDEALDAVLDKYVEPVDRDEVLTRGIKAMVEGLDSHSRYLTADERQLIRDRAGSGTTGLSVAVRTGGAEVTGVVPGSPAASAGLQPGDRVVKIGRRKADELSQVEADAALLGNAGDRVDLSVASSGAAAREVALELVPVGRKRVQTHVIAAAGGKTVGCIKIHEFRTEVGRQVKHALADLKRHAGKAGLAGLVLDLRSNPGGEVDQALIVADMFIDAGVLTRTRGRGGRVLREEKAHAKGTDTTTPIVVLVDEYTASAAELLAAALRDHGRATLIGTHTYGKGTVQQVHGLPDGSVLTLTIARYFSPNDERIDGVGLRPDTTADWGTLSKQAGAAATLRALGLAPA
jgi:carboxyl-terminal processing protease